VSEKVRGGEKNLDALAPPKKKPFAPLTPELTQPNARSAAPSNRHSGLAGGKADQRHHTPKTPYGFFVISKNKYTINTIE